ncbi:MAG: DsrE family protein [Bacteroidales bacterium]|nr:DsrE family protein [Bacteroidales bacterium]
MKKIYLIPVILMSLYALNIHAQCTGTATKTTKPTAIGIIIYSNDAETIWNALRFANYSVSTGDTVKIFLLGKGVDMDSMDSKNFNIKEQSEIYLKNGGKFLACGTCLQSRNVTSPKVCSISSMSDLYEIIRNSKVLLTF